MARMAVCKSAALAALLLASASTAPPVDGEGANVDEECLLALPATSAQLGKTGAGFVPLREVAKTLVSEIGELTDDVSDLQAQLNALKASIDGDAECCNGVKEELEPDLKELEAKIEQLANPDPCGDEARGKWHEAIGGLDFKAECRYADYTEQTIKRDHFAFGSKCYGSGSVAVETLWGDAKGRCAAHCRQFGAEIGQLLAKQYCNYENVTLDNYRYASEAFPSVESGYISGTVVDGCFKQQSNGCNEVLKALTSPCDTGRPFDADIAKAYNFCRVAQHALNP